MRILIQKSAALTHFFSRMADNPIVIKELRGRMRGRRAFVVLTIYLIIISALIVFLYSTLQEQAVRSGYINTYDRQNIGKNIFMSVVGIELIMIGFIGPALTAGAITAERERQTLDLLRTTLISPYTLTLGKLISASTYLLLLIIAALPIQALAFLLGGIGPEEIFCSSIMLVINIIFFCALGLLCSSFSKNTLTATITCYSSILGGLLVTGLVLYAFFQYAQANNLSNGTPTQYLIIICLWHFAVTNSLLAGAASESLLIYSQALFYGNVPMGNGSNMMLISPWILHVGLYTILSAIFILISVLFIRKLER